MHIRTQAILALMAIALVARGGEAQTSRPRQPAVDGGGPAIATASSPSSTVSETTIIRRSANPMSSTRPAGSTKVAPGGFDTTRVMLSLAIVILLIFVLRWISQRIFGKTLTGRASRAVQVISRNVISPKQQLLVIQVGRRLVVVGDSGQQMHPLCEITDPEEMAALIGQLHEEKRESTGNPFGALFGRAGSEFEKPGEPQRSVDVSDDEDESTGGSTGPSHVQGTRDELSGLMEKVRVMSRQFRRT